MPTGFAFETFRKVLSSLDNLYLDNWDHRRAAPPPARDFSVDQENQRLNELGYIKYANVKARALRMMSALAPILDELEKTYALLSDEYSRNVMVEQFTYRMIGHEHFRLPYPTDDFDIQIEKIEAAAVPVPGVAVKTLGADQPLSSFDLNEWSIPIKLMARSLGIYTMFLSQQYAYSNSGNETAALENDVILDLGGSYGDSALYFANKVGSAGRVYVWEFLPSSLDLMNKNFASNPILSNRIHVERAAAWSKSGEKMYFSDRGPATKVQAEQDEECREGVETLSIDDLVARESLQVDLIKMDIEGAEVAALKGGAFTIRTQRPKLAISVYHKFDDLATIPQLIASMCPDYSFHLQSSTNFGAELILFGRPN